MSKINKNDLIAFCDEIVKIGEELSISWSGGNDSGEYLVKRNGKEIEYPLPETVQYLIELAEESLGYYSFSGNYYCEGSAYYDSINKCFRGLDSYEDSETTAVACAIPIDIPSRIWFDSLQIEIDYYNKLEVNVKLVLANGPISDDHKAFTKNLENNLRAIIPQIIDSIEDFASMMDRIVVTRGEFIPEGEKLKFLIKEINYEMNTDTETEVLIDLKN